MNTSVAQRRPLGQILISEGILSEDHSVEVKFGSDDIAALFAPLPE